MPEPRHREVKLRVAQVPVEPPLPSMALDTGIPAGMTTFWRATGFVYNDESWSLGTGTNGIP